MISTSKAEGIPPSGGGAAGGGSSTPLNIEEVLLEGRIPRGGYPGVERLGGILPGNGRKGGLAACC